MHAEKASVCPLDCPDTCSLSVTVENNRIVKVRGSSANPYTDGVICNKVARSYPEFVHGPNRLTTPLRRTGKNGSATFEPISWNDALDAVYTGFQHVISKYGPQAIAPLNYAGPHGALAGGSMDFRFFNKLGATELDRGPLCGGVKSLAHTSLFGGMPGTPPEQGELAELNVIWSNNATVSNLHFASLAEKRRRAGAKLVVVDPRRIKVAERADLHIQLRPGTDTVLALAIAAELERIGAIDKSFVSEWTVGFDAYMDRARTFSVEKTADICGVPADQIRAFAAMYKNASPALISIGNGLERNRNGGGSVRAVLALPVLAGKFGVKGGGAISKSGNAFPRTPRKLLRPELAAAPRRVLNIIDMAAHILDDNLDPPVKAVMIYNHNPVAVHPDQNRMRRALSRDDLFIVGCDIAMTDSMHYADIVLPASSHFEHADVFAAYGQQFLQRAEPVIPPVGQSLPNTEIFRRLAARFGFNGPEFTATDEELMDDAFDGADPRLQGFKPSALPLNKAVRMEFDGEPAMPFVNVFPSTPSGKVELYSESLETKYGEGLPSYTELGSDYPLTLISPSSDKRTNATFGGLSASAGRETLYMHPDDAVARNLSDGDTVKIWNGLGAVVLALRVSDSVRSGVVSSDKGTWLATSETGQTVSALVDGSKTDIGDGACYNDCRVEVARHTNL